MRAPHTFFAGASIPPTHLSHTLFRPPSPSLQPPTHLQPPPRSRFRPPLYFRKKLKKCLDALPQLPLNLFPRPLQ
jgi:hypothetical protein